MRELIAPLVLLASAVLAAQQSPPVFRGGTDLVEVDVVVHDRDGRFVTDLSVEDFTVRDGKEPQTIEQFYLHKIDRGAATRSNAAPRPGGTSSDAPAGKRFFVVVFDDRHLTPAGFKSTRAAASSLFEREFRAGDIGGVMIGGRMVNDRLTSDREELLEAVRNAKPNLASAARMFDTRAWPRLSDIEAVRITVNDDRDVTAEAIRRACAEDPSQCRFAPDAVREKARQLTDQSRVESAQTLQLLRAALNGLARFDGRKTIVLMSEGFMAQETWPLVQDAVGLAARANARVYALDARGLDRGLRSIHDNDPGGSDSRARMLEQMDFGADSLNSLAVDTGGFVVRNTNLFDEAIDRIADDVSNYYVLGYRPTTPRDGKFHPLRVTVRRAGVSVRARRGYLATPRSPVSAPTSTAAAPNDSEAPAAIAPESTPVGPVAETLLPPGPNATVSDASAIRRVRPHAAENAMRLAPSTAADADGTAGWAAFQRGDLDTAYERLSVAAARPGAQAWVHYTLGISSYALGHYKEAADAWERVRGAAAEFEPVYFDLIDAYLQQREFDSAIRTARGALERWPRDAEMYQALGVVQTVRGSLDDAVKSFREALAIAPQDANAYFNLGKTMELKYVKSRHYVSQLRRWVSNENDRKAAIDNYRRHIELGGAYADSARQGLQRLEWVAASK